ncbi:hypothetical protein SeMB42_g02251 [Synchytrium endobioticum]|uniref:DUF1754-domain-containing protein n=1 Tax=Synchytrium endobioticum TaxID=286115 RepID=A0A507DGJ7_9FUNG|nr:hypothetical protein SeLEV6574_g01062 [Synchytrium endobioticum]TPX50445.1 hypothetical protein SeMB42_g02251 [Synchytrium endobioticum]
MSLIGGSLKLKGSGGVQKKSSKPSSSKPKIESADKEKRSSSDGDFSSLSPSSASSSTPAATSSATKPGGRIKTPAELKFEEIRKQRALEKAEKMALKSHKERVSEFNQKLESLSEHYDIPKVGPG